MYSDVIALVGAAKGLAIPAAAPRALVPRLLTATPATAATNQPGPYWPHRENSIAIEKSSRTGICHHVCHLRTSLLSLFLII